MTRLLRVFLVVAVATGLMLAWASLHGPVAGAKGCRSLGVAKTIRCAANYVGGVSPDKAVNVADCESGLNPYASNYPYEGLFEHHRTYWYGPWWAPRTGRVDRYWWGLGSSIWSARIQAFVTVRMVKHTGWAPWSCA